MRVLLVTRSATAVSIRKILEDKEYVCDVARPGDKATRLAKQPGINVIVLGLKDASPVLCALRAVQVRTPILVLSRFDGPGHIAQVLEDGADDCLANPFKARELVARLEALVRRSRGRSESAMRTGNLLVDPARRTAEVRGERLRLTIKEYGVLELLSLEKRLGCFVSTEMFLEHLYKRSKRPKRKIINVFVCYIRKKIAEKNGGVHYIKTSRDWGFALEDPEPSSEPESVPEAA